MLHPLIGNQGLTDGQGNGSFTFGINFLVPGGGPTSRYGYLHVDRIFLPILILRHSKSGKYYRTKKIKKIFLKVFVDLDTEC